jgi:hypothetical protein
MKANHLLSAFMILTGTQTLADPLSAVDWLSESLNEPQITAPDRPIEGVEIEPIETTNLSNLQKDTVGLLPSQVSGIPTNFWGDSSVTKIATLIRNAPTSQLPEITALWRRIILAEINPPVGMSEENTLLLARLDNLLTIGALDPVEALLKAADPNNSHLFRRWFDVSILTQRADDACKRMVNTPNFAPTMQARIFCLARAGDWSAASVTLNTGKAIGAISKEQARLLAVFLDPDAFDGEPDPPLPEVLTPLTFVMREALALPRPTQSLPLAFLHMDLQNRAGWKQRLMSAERLVHERAIPSAALLDLYLEGTPSASGGVWERVAAVQKLNNALENSSDEELSDKLINAFNALAPVGLQAALADWFAASLEGHTLTPEAQKIGFELSVLNSNTIELALLLTPDNQNDRFIASILTDNFVVPAQDDLQRAIANALTGVSPKTVLHQTIDEGRQGEAIISALTLLKDGAATDVGDVEVALSVLAYDGFKDEAKRIATQLLFFRNTS